MQKETKISRKIIDFKLPIGYDKDLLNKKIKKILQKNTDYSIIGKSLDARNKNNIFWNFRVELFNKTEKHINKENIFSSINTRKREEKIIIVGSGPAGFFSGLILQRAGFQVLIIERGNKVEEREKDIEEFESTGILNEKSNYTNGEGGAGTFSDGKLTARSKKIREEKEFIFQSFVYAGAPEEIKYISSPHLGTDNLKKIVKNMRKQFIDLGGKISFNTEFIGFKTRGKEILVNTDKSELKCDYLILAIGHSSHKTYRSLINSGIQFKTKPFAIGTRVEHRQELINLSQWGKKSLSGVKAAEYKLTHKSDNLPSVYSFCMCPGGKIVPSSPLKNINIVNGMSNYLRNSPYSNSAIVVATDLNKIYQRVVSAPEALDWVFTLENKFYNLKNDYSAPAISISDLLKGINSKNLPDTSYPFEIFQYDFKKLFPDFIYQPLISGIKNFTRKIKGFEEGIALGLESKTSSPIQVLRDKNGKVFGQDKIYMVGEGSGYSGGIISSAADGIKAAMDIIKN